MASNFFEFDSLRFFDEILVRIENASRIDVDVLVQLCIHVCS